MKKILKFSRNADSLHHLGRQLFAQKDYINAACALQNAVKIRPNSTNLLMDLANCYLELKLFSDAQFLFLKSINIDKNLHEAYIGCTTAAVQAALVPFPKTMQHVINMPNFYQYPDEIMRIVNNPPNNYIKLYNKNDYSFQYNKALQYIASNQLNFALIMLSSIPSNANEYINARAYIALINLYDDKIENTYEIANSVLAVDNNNLIANIAKLVACASLYKLDEMPEIIDKVMSYDGDDFASLMRIYYCAIEIQNNPMIEKFTAKLREFLPYDIKILLSYTIALYNNGKIKESQYFSGILNKLYPHNPVVIYYTNIIKHRITDNIINQYKLPKEELEDYINRIEYIIENTQDITVIEQALKNDKNLTDFIDWFLINGENPHLQELIGQILLDSKKWNKKITSLLLHPRIDNEIKQKWILYKLTNCENKKFSMVCDGGFNFYNPKKPILDYASFLIEDAYWIAYSILVFISTQFEKSLNKSYIFICKIYRNNYEKLCVFSSAVFAAVLTHFAKISNFSSKNDNFLEYFDCSKEEYNKCINIITMEADI